MSDEADDFARDMAVLNNDKGGTGEADNVEDIQTPPTDGVDGSGDEGGSDGDDGGGGTGKDTSFEDIFDEGLGKTDDGEIEEGEDGKPPKKPGEEEEEEEDQTDFADTSRGRPSAKAIVKKFPGIFKEFPGLKDAYFNERLYREAVGTPEAAKQAVERSEILEKFEETLTAGDFSLTLTALAKSHPESVVRMAKNFPPTLYKNDQDTYMEAVRPVIVNALKYARGEGQKHGNNNLINSIKHVAKVLDLPVDLELPQPRESAKEDPEKKKIEEDRKELLAERRIDFEEKTGKSAMGFVRTKLVKSLANVQGLSEFTKNAVVKNCMEKLGLQLRNNKEHMRLMQTLWTQAERAGYKGDWADRLVGTYLNRARQILPAIRQSELNEAMGRKKSPQAGTPPGKPQVRKATPGNQAGRTLVRQGFKPGTVQSKDIDYSRTSDLDILNRRVVLKK